MLADHKSYCTKNVSNNQLEGYITYIGDIWVFIVRGWDQSTGQTVTPKGGIINNYLLTTRLVYIVIAVSGSLHSHTLQNIDLAHWQIEQQTEGGWVVPILNPCEC